MARKIKEAPATYPANYGVELGERGRVVIPAEVRQRLDLKEGERMVLVVQDDGSMKLTPWKTVVDNTVGMLAHIDPGVSWSDELIADRRAEAAREDRE
jgi:AbrB family looped-hinge helix DNA binding protein